MSDLRIVFMGTPDFAVAPLDALIEAGFNIVGVVTNPDKPAGRGRKIQESAVKIYAKGKGLKILQPEKFRDEEFLTELSELKADLQVVVAFKMLPELVWNMPSLGTINIHASLLPHYRGAAPLNWVIINGEKETGATTFLLKHEIDTGNIIMQEKLTIADDENIGTLHDRLMLLGSQLIVKTVEAVDSGDYALLEQDDLLAGETAKHAPKIFKEDCRIDWNEDINKIYNLIRGLSPYPAAWTVFKGSDGKELNMKIFAVSKEIAEHKLIIGTLISDSKTYVKVATHGGYMILESIQMAGKKRMLIQDFLRGFDITPFLS
jgi:methionyl-tRNA formyltransferase